MAKTGIIEDRAVSDPDFIDVPGVSVDLDFERDQYVQQDVGTSITQLLTISRASTAYEDDSAGRWIAFPPNVLRRTDRGTLIEESRTNVVLWNRDLTNGVWFANNLEIAKDQTGIDGLTNAASSLMATSENGTVVQKLTLSSSARVQSAFVKRISGSGVINMTMDGGITWTRIRATSPEWTRVVIPTQTLANPLVGFQVATTGDKIAVDFVQNENSASGVTSPIWTTSEAVLRAADVVTMTMPPNFGDSITLFAKYSQPTTVTERGFNVIIDVNDGTHNNRETLFIADIVGKVASANSSTDGINAARIDAYENYSTLADAIIAYAAAPNERALVHSGVVVEDGMPTRPRLDSVFIGSRPGGFSYFNGYIKRVAMWPTTRKPNSFLQKITRSRLMEKSGAIASGIFGSGLSESALKRALAVSAPTLAPGPLGNTERLYLYWFARDLFRFEADLVELGPFLGASTQALAAGLHDNPRRGERGFQLHSFDLFNYDGSWGGGIEKLRGYANLQVGQDFEDLFWKHLGDLAPFVRARKGNILEARTYDRPIEFLFIDLAKTEHIMAHIADVFFPRLTVGSVVLNQDYMFGYLPYIKSFMEYFAEYFEVLDPDADFTIRFNLIKPWDVPPAETKAYRLLPLAVKKQLHQKAHRRFAPHRLPVLEESLRSFDNPHAQTLMETGDLGKSRRAQAMVRSLS
jgi:hypothetical protein